MKRVPQFFAVALFAGATTVIPTQDSEAWWGGNKDRWDDDRWYDGPGWGGYPGGYGGYPGYGGWGGYPGYGGWGGYPGYGGYGGYPGYGGYGGYPGYGGYGGGYPAYGGGYSAPQSTPPASSYSQPSSPAP